MEKKILHIISGDLGGGAARGAYWLHNGLIKLGVNSKILVNSYENYGDPNVCSYIKTPADKIRYKIKFKLNQLLLSFYINRTGEFFSPSLFGFDITKHPLYEWADIIHLHWINGGFLSVKSISKIKKPIVWTVRDMWPFTGGCHYSLNCENYKLSCGNCPQLGSKKSYDLSRLVSYNKLQFFSKNILLIGISNWISEKIEGSNVFSNNKVKTIFNCIESDSFYPIGKDKARDVLGIKTNKKIILTGAQDSNHKYKGFDKFLSAVKHFHKDEVLLLFFGNLKSSDIESLGVEYINFGFLKDLVSLRLLYSAADVFVAPSILEAFGKTLVESMSCKTPVVCFNIGGPKDIVDHKINGYKSELNKTNDLFNGINWVLENNINNTLGIAGRSKVVNCFDSKVIAEQYLFEYAKIEI